MTTLIHNYAQYMHNYSSSVVGARGYTGIETARLLLSHPHVKLTKCFATSDFSLSKYILDEKAKSVQCLKESELMSNLTDYVFLATPAEVSMDLAPKIQAAGSQVIDLSGAFRLKKSNYSKWYGFDHTESETLSQATYGLVPWAMPSAKNKNAVIANPGCYASAILLALIPLLKNKLIQPDNIVIDAKSGTSGAGKKPAENLLFTEAADECTPYKVGKHQHYPEIQEAIEQFSGVSIQPHFSTHLLPVRRGIIASIYGKLAKSITVQDIEQAYTKAYANYPLVQFGQTSARPELLSLKNVVGSARTHISFHVENDQLYVFSTIDNLLKGDRKSVV